MSDNEPTLVTDRVQPYRLAFRNEGDFVNCYFSAPDTMSEALLLGSFRRVLLDSVPGVWEAWRTLMRDAMDTVNLNAFGERGKWEETPAPEHEKAGRG